MQVQNFTEKAQAALQGAHTLAVRMKHGELNTMHLLLALAEQEDGVAPHVLEKMGYNVNALISGGRALLDKEAQVSGGGRKLAASMGFNEVLVRADTEAGRNVRAATYTSVIGPAAVWPFAPTQA